MANALAGKVQSVLGPVEAAHLHGGAPWDGQVHPVAAQRQVDR